MFSDEVLYEITTFVLYEITTFVLYEITTFVLYEITTFVLVDFNRSKQCFKVAGTKSLENLL